MAVDSFVPWNIDVEPNVFGTIHKDLKRRIQDEAGPQENPDGAVNVFLFYQRRPTRGSDEENAAFFQEIADAISQLVESHPIIEGVVLVDCGSSAHDISSDEPFLSEALGHLSGWLGPEVYADVLLMDYDVETKFGKTEIENIIVRNLNDPSVADDLMNQVLDRYEKFQMEINPDTLSFAEEEIEKIIREVMEELIEALQELFGEELELAQA